MAERFFVTVLAPGPDELRKLQDRDLDLFQATARHIGPRQAAIEGLITLDDIAELVRGGYRVLVEDDEAERAVKPEEVAEFEQWLRETEEED